MRGGGVGNSADWGAVELFYGYVGVLFLSLQQCAGKCLLKG